MSGRADPPLREVPAGPATLPGILALNAAHATETSALDAAGLRALVEAAVFARALVAGAEVAAFLIALDQDAPYASPNFLWFRARHDRFVYVDRLVTAPAWRGRGCARRLYAALFAQAARAGHDRVACEVNREPPTRLRRPPRGARLPAGRRGGDPRRDEDGALPPARDRGGRG
ncbi:GNAT family N-acetyltransferase [Methylobacterium sp. JK268]